MTVIIKVPASRRPELEKITKDLEVKKPGLQARPKSIRLFFDGVKRTLREHRSKGKSGRNDGRPAL